MQHPRPGPAQELSQALRRPDVARLLRDLELPFACTKRERGAVPTRPPSSSLPPFRSDFFFL